MIQIRRGMFETNSSSSHSIVLGYEIAPVKDSTETIEFGDFNWGYEELKTWQKRASYAMTYAFNYGCEADIELLRAVVKAHVPSATFAMDDIPLRVIWDKEVEDTGNIDHQSTFTAEKCFESFSKLELMIFGDSTVYIDNDNH